MIVYIVMEKSAHMPRSCQAGYRKIAVVEINQEYTAYNKEPAMIREGAKGLLRIVRTYPFVPSAGKTERSGLVQTRRAAAELALQLNSTRDVATAEDIIGAGGSA